MSTVRKKENKFYEKNETYFNNGSGCGNGSF